MCVCSVFTPRTALILGCEYACTDAVEVLLKCGADVTAVDTLGHDGYHYARLSKNPELVRLVKTYLDGATKGQMFSPVCVHVCARACVCVCVCVCVCERETDRLRDFKEDAVIWHINIPQQLPVLFLSFLS